MTPGRARPEDRGHDIAVTVANRQRLLAVDRRWLAAVIRRALGSAAVTRGEIGVAVVDDRRMARLHERWTAVPGPTDVLTFDLADVPGAGSIHGDIAVSAETARRVAREVGWPPRSELAYYVVHGLAHLLGHDDHEPAARRRMRACERRLLAAAGLPAPPTRRRRRSPRSRKSPR